MEDERERENNVRRSKTEDAKRRHTTDPIGPSRAPARSSAFVHGSAEVLEVFEEGKECGRKEEERKENEEDRKESTRQPTKKEDDRKESTRQNTKDPSEERRHIDQSEAKPKLIGLGWASGGSSALMRGSPEALSSSSAEVEWTVVDRSKKKKIRMVEWRPCVVNSGKKKNEVKPLEIWPEGLANVEQE